MLDHLLARPPPARRRALLRRVRVGVIARKLRPSAIRSLTLDQIASRGPTLFRRSASPREAHQPERGVLGRLRARVDQPLARSTKHSVPFCRRFLRQVSLHGADGGRRRGEHTARVRRTEVRCDPMTILTLPTCDAARIHTGRQISSNASRSCRHQQVAVVWSRVRKIRHLHRVVECIRVAKLSKRPRFDRVERLRIDAEAALLRHAECNHRQRIVVARHAGALRHEVCGRSLKDRQRPHYRGANLRHCLRGGRLSNGDKETSEKKNHRMCHGRRQDLRHCIRAGSPGGRVRRRNCVDYR